MGRGFRHARDKRHLRERATADSFWRVDVEDSPLLDRSVGLRSVPELGRRQRPDRRWRMRR